MGRGSNRLTLSLFAEGPRLNGKAIGRTLNWLCTQAGIPRFTAHQLRHTVGTEGASAGLTGSELQALMGHEGLSTTQQYIRVTGRDLERAMVRLKAWREAKDSVASYLYEPMKLPQSAG